MLAYRHATEGGRNGHRRHPLHAGTSWFEPIETLLACMDNYGVRRALLTQHRGMFDNSYLLECIARFPGRSSAIAGVDAADPNALSTMEELAANPDVCGVRLLPRTAPPATTPPPSGERPARSDCPSASFSSTPPTAPMPASRNSSSACRTPPSSLSTSAACTTPAAPNPSSRLMTTTRRALSWLRDPTPTSSSAASASSASGLAASCPSCVSRTSRPLWRWPTRRSAPGA